MAERRAGRRVAITGVGVVSAIGNSYEEFVAGLRSGRDGLTRSEHDPVPYPLGRVRGWTEPSVERVSPRLEGAARRCVLSAVDAARQAIGQAGLSEDGHDPQRRGVYLGTCQGFAGEPDSLRAQAATLSLAHLAEEVAAVLDVRGPAVTTTNACAAGGSAIALADDALRRGRIDVAIVGGADSLAAFTIIGFDSLRSLDPLGCSPYGRSGGLSVGEGAGILVLEDLDGALARGATVLAELAGAAMSADGYHPTAPDPTGRGAVLAVTRALRVAGLTADDVGYVNGHGTGTPANDAMERAAFRLIFGDRASHLPISSTKSQIGHTLGAAGALEATACVAAISEHLLPPTIRVPDDAVTDVDVVARPGRSADVDVAVSVNYAFGGSNVALVVRSTDTGRDGADGGRAGDDSPGRRPSAVPRVVVTGIGAVGSLGLGIDAWGDALRTGARPIERRSLGAGISMLAAPIPPITQRFAAGAAWRRMDEFERAAVASAQLAWTDAGLQLSRDGRADVAVISGTNAGSIGSIVDYAEQLRHGEPDPAMFPHTAINAASGHVCTVMGLNGPNLSISTGGASSVAAIETAVGLIERGEVDVALVCCLDDMPERVLRYAHGSGRDRPPGRITDAGVRPFDVDADGTAPGGAAVTLVLERDGHAGDRGARPWARVVSTALVRGNARSDVATTDGWRSAMARATDLAAVDLGSVDVCFAAASGTAEADLAEAEAIAATLGSSCRVTAPKSIVGDCVGASGAVNVAFAALALRDGLVAPNVGIGRAAGPALRHVQELETEVSLTWALANASSGGGSAGTVLLERW